MKRCVATVILFIMMLVTSLAWSAGSCVQSLSSYQTASQVPFKVVKFVCTGDAANGSIPNTAIDSTLMTYLVNQYYLYTVAAYPTSGGKAPDPADVFILDANGEDLLGSTDGGTTANKGANLIHATLKKTTMPYSHYLSAAYFPAVLNTLTLKVSNQTTTSAKYTIELIFAR